MLGDLPVPSVFTLLNCSMGAPKSAEQSEYSERLDLCGHAELVILPYYVMMVRCYGRSWRVSMTRYSLLRQREQGTIVLLGGKQGC